MRIVGGKHRGRVLSALGRGDAPAHLRPTSDKMRESLFNLLAHSPRGNVIAGARVLDLCAGTGALGLEALSRGAAFALFIDKGVKARGLLQKNIALLDEGDNSQVLIGDVLRLGDAGVRDVLPPFDLVFFDPPYGKDFGAQTLPRLRSGGWLAPQATILWEEGAQQIAPLGFCLIDTRTYGQSWVHVLNLSPTHPA